MDHRRKQLRRALAEHGWELVEVIDSEEWWADQFWNVQSKRNRWGYEIVLTFLVDPQWTGAGARTKSGAVHLVTATEGLPEDWLPAMRDNVAEQRVDGRFDRNLLGFLDYLHAHRDQGADA